MNRSWDDVKASRRSQVTHPLLSFGAELGRISAENKAAHEEAGKSLISLAIGDPAQDGNLPPPQQLMEELDTHVSSGKCNGYSPSVGLPALRSARWEGNSFSPWQHRLSMCVSTYASITTEM